MPGPDSTPDVPPPPRVYSPLAGLLSYLVPGLGQIYQGRFAKGILFLVCLYGLFFYGLYLGQWQNVYLQPTIGGAGRPARDQRPIQAVLDRARFLGQVWIGVAAWPAIVQSQTPNPPQAKVEEMPTDKEVPEHRLLGNFERMPNDKELNDFLRDHDKTPDLGWMYTVIAGVLNILVIYDAFAGPAFRTVPAAADESSGAATEGATS